MLCIYWEDVTSCVLQPVLCGVKMIHCTDESVCSARSSMLFSRLWIWTELIPVPKAARVLGLRFDRKSHHLKWLGFVTAMQASGRCLSCGTQIVWALTNGYDHHTEVRKEVDVTNPHVHFGRTPYRNNNRSRRWVPPNSHRGNLLHSPEQRCMGAFYQYELQRNRVYYRAWIECATSQYFFFVVKQ